MLPLIQCYRYTFVTRFLNVTMLFLCKTQLRYNEVVSVDGGKAVDGHLLVMLRVFLFGLKTSALLCIVFWNAEHFIVVPTCDSGIGGVVYTPTANARVMPSRAACSCLMPSVAFLLLALSLASQGRHRQHLLVKTDCLCCTTVHWPPRICRHWITHFKYSQGRLYLAFTWLDALLNSSRWDGSNSTFNQ